MVKIVKTRLKKYVHITINNIMLFGETLIGQPSEKRTEFIIREKYQLVGRTA